MIELVSADIGGTHARFALATVRDGRVVSLGEPATLRTADYAGLEAAWTAYAATLGRPAPQAAAIAVASPVTNDVIRFTNNPWVIDRSALDDRLGLDRHLLVNDFGAVAHAVAHAADDDLLPICGPAEAASVARVTTIVGPGTGLGVGQLLGGLHDYRVIETEGGHIDYAPLDAIEDAILARLRAQHARVSAERVVGGPGLLAIYETLLEIERRPASSCDATALWGAALAGADSVAVAALDRFCLALGAVAGDLALAQGADRVVIAGGLGYRLRDVLPRSGFAERFIAKGRFRERMAAIPVRLIVHPQPGLLGAAAAFAQQTA